MLRKFLMQVQRKKPVFIFTAILFLNLIQFEAKAQLPGWVRKTDEWVRNLTMLTRDYKNLKSEINKNSASYNKNVTVSKGNPGKSNPNPDNIPENKLTKPIIKENNFTNLVWEPANFFDGQLFPSAIISMASYKGELSGIIEAISRPIGFNLYSNKSNIPLRYEIESVDKKYFDKIEGTYMYEQAGKQVYLDPPIPWNYENLARLATSVPLSIYFRLYDEDGKKVEKLETVQLRSINDCIYYYKDVNMQFMFSAFVQEEHKEIDNILRDALNTKMVSRWIGYQNEAKEVDQQVAAIWRVLHERGFVYSSILATIGDGGNVHSQAVRTFDNALKTNQANCVDGTVVFASILKKIGINPIMILVPGHCFLGYYTDQKNTSAKFLETTMLSRTSINSTDGKKEIELLASAKTNEAKNKAYKQLFDAAQNTAMQEYQDNKSKNAVTAIDVTAYRKLIKPIPVY
jgi:hypothetical protein